MPSCLPGGRSIGCASRGALLLALLLATACGREEAPQPVSALPVEAPDVSETPLPERGAARVEFADGRVSVLSNGAQRLAVLRQLAELAGFELVVGNLERRALQLRIENVGLDDALSAILSGVRYDAEYGYDARLGSHVLVRLSVGQPVEAAAAAQPQAERGGKERQPESSPEDQARARKFLKELEKHRAARSPEERERLREERAARAEAMEQELIEQLGDPDPEVRAEAVSELPVHGEGEKGAERLQRVARVSAEDPDPQVRTAAVERLGETDLPDAVAPLVEALSDPDREVVLQALDALQDIDDPSAIPYLEPLLQDPDPEIREEAGFTQEWLQW